MGYASETLWDPQSIKFGTHDIPTVTIGPLPDWALRSAFQHRRTVGLGLSERQSGTVVSPVWPSQDSPSAGYLMSKSNPGEKLDDLH